MAYVIIATPERLIDVRKAILLIGLLLAGCSSQQARDVEGTTVELDAYSGRPNPVWQLTRGEFEALEARLSGLPDATGVAPDHLGYRGFIIHPGSTRPIRVYSGLVFMGDDVYRDVKNAEGWLIDYAARHGRTVPR